MSLLLMFEMRGEEKSDYLNETTEEREHNKVLVRRGSEVLNAEFLIHYTLYHQS